MSECAYENGILVPIDFCDENQREMQDCFTAISELDEETRRLVRDAAMQMSANIIKRGMMFLIDGEDIPLRIDIIASAFGLTTFNGTSDTDLARKHGTSKQNIQQHKTRLIEQLGLKMIYTRGSKKNKEAYAKTNYRRPPKVW